MSEYADFTRNQIYNLDGNSPPYCGIIITYLNTEDTMPDNKGRIQKGERLSKKTEFKKGEHWRDEKPFWNHDWLYAEYITKGRAAVDIANEYDVTENAVLFWLKKLDIPRRSMKEIRSVKHWGLSGELNGMFGKKGVNNPHWKGGISPERQALYSSQEWAKAVRIVWKRDNHTCQRCLKVWTEQSGDKMHIHHMVGFEVVELRSEPSNLILLCEDCHRWVHSRKNVNKEFIGNK